MEGVAQVQKGKFLNTLERVGNALPHPALLFGIFALMILFLSGICSWLGWSATHPANGEVIETVNLLSKSGFHKIVLNMVENFTGFAPLGIVLVAMLGIGIAESSGLIGVAIRKLVLSAPKYSLSFVMVFAGILSNMASDVGYVLLIPLAGTIFIAVNRHPIVGMAAAFAGVSGGFSANLILGTIDPLLAGLSTEAAQIVDVNYEVNPTANYYFMFISTFIIAFAGTWVTEKIIAPRFGEYKGNETVSMDHLSPLEKKGLKAAGAVFLLFVAIILIGLIPENGFLRTEEGSILKGPLIKGVISWLVFIMVGMGLAYGFVSGNFKKQDDVVKGMTASIKSLSGYIVLVFFAAQFVAFFKWSNLGLIFAIKGAGFLNDLFGASESGLMAQGFDWKVIPLMILFILFAAVMNMFMGSASAKWAVLGPVFIPMFMLMGYSPELSQVVYRIGDSVTNIISPMMSFFALIITYFQKYDKNSGIGTIMSTMIPYSFAFFFAWIGLLIIWIVFDIPLGPGIGIHLP
ncbi:MAG: AbgT family transporter [Bacteroidales bacterium]